MDERQQIIDKIYHKKESDRKGFDFDSLWHPPISQYLSTQDVQQLHAIALSAKYNARPKEKYKLMDDILKQRGFTRFHAGTNRLVYKSEYDSSFVLKVGIDKVGITDNPSEYYNQFAIKPFCCKIFDVTPCGTVAMVERVNPIKNREQFRDVADDIFFTIVTEFSGLIMEDIGNNFFMNWGIRDGFGPVILDYPYTYTMNLKKMHCTHVDKETGKVCGGLIDYDIGFNTLVCEHCGARYTARELGETNHAISIQKSLDDLEKESVYTMEKFIVTATINGKTFANGRQIEDDLIKPVSRQRADKSYLRKFGPHNRTKNNRIEHFETSVVINGKVFKNGKCVSEPPVVDTNKPLVAHVELGENMNCTITSEKNHKKDKSAYVPSRPVTDEDIVLPNGKVLYHITETDEEKDSRLKKEAEESKVTSEDIKNFEHFAKQCPNDTISVQFPIIPDKDGNAVKNPFGKNLEFNISATEEIPDAPQVENALDGVSNVKVVSAKALMMKDKIEEFIHENEGPWFDAHGNEFTENDILSCNRAMVEYIENLVCDKFSIDYDSAHALTEAKIEADFPVCIQDSETAHSVDEEGLDEAKETEHTEDKKETTHEPNRLEEF